MTVVVSLKNTWAKDISVDELKMMWEPAAQGKVTKWSQIRKGWPEEALKLYGAGSDSGTFDYFTEAIVGKAKSSRGDYTGSEDDNTLVQGIANDKGALAKAPKKGSISPSAKTVEDGSYYPLSRPIFIYVSAKAVERKEVNEFTEFYINNAAALSQEVKYVALPAKAYALVLENFKKKKLGTAFGGVPEVGLKIEVLLKREAQH
jgi:phosphate transport system substrate-binding protein